MMTPEPSLIMDKVKPPARACACGNKIAGADTHSACAACLGLQHARAALASPATCEHCARLSFKTRRRRLARQALAELAESTQGHTTGTGADWNEQLDTIAPLTDPNEPEASRMVEHWDFAGDDSDSGDESISLGSDDEDTDEPFVPSPAAKQEKCL